MNETDVSSYTEHASHVVQCSKSLLALAAYKTGSKRNLSAFKKGENYYYIGNE